METHSIGSNTISPPVLVTGCARSGSSMTAGIIHRCGSFGGRVDNTFENIEGKKSVLKPYAHLIGCDYRWQKPLPDIKDLAPLAGLVRRMETTMKYEGFRYGSWFYKSAGLALTWPVWVQAFPKAKWVVVRRMDKDVVNSCMKTGYMNSYNSEDGWHSWLETYKRRFYELHAHVYNVREVWPSRFVVGDFSEIRDVIEWLGLQWKEDKVKAFIKPQLWRDENGGKSDISRSGSDHRLRLNEDNGFDPIHNGSQSDDQRSDRHQSNFSGPTQGGGTLAVSSLSLNEVAGNVQSVNRGDI